MFFCYLLAQSVSTLNLMLSDFTVWVWQNRATDLIFQLTTFQGCVEFFYEDKSKLQSL